MVDHFSDALIKNPIVGQTSKNPQLRDWHTNSLGRLPGLKFMRTLWVCDVAGGPFNFAATRPGSTALGLEEAHRSLRISPDEFDEVAAELGRSLDHFGVPTREKSEVMLDVEPPPLKEAERLLADEGYDPTYGARPLKRVIQQRLENPIASRILRGEFGDGDVIHVDADGAKRDFTFSKGAPAEAEMVGR